MSAQVHHLFASDADLEAAWNRYVALVKELEADPSLRINREHIDRQLQAFHEYRRLFEKRLHLEAGG